MCIVNPIFVKQYVHVVHVYVHFHVLHVLMN